MRRSLRINEKVVTDILTGEVLERKSYQHFGAIARAMGVRLASVFTTTFIGPLPASAVETIVLTTGAISEAVDNAPILIFWFASILTGTANTQLQFRLRRGTALTGALVGTPPWTNTAGAAIQSIASGVYVDSPGVVAGQQYTLTVVQASATGAGTWNDGCLLAMVL